jgi:hypothetical protein
MKIRKIIPVPLVAFLIATGMAQVGCTHETQQLDEIRTVCFDTEVFPIFLSSCAVASCHDGSMHEGPRLDSYEGILRGVEPGNSAASPIYRSLVSRYREVAMPPDYPLSLEERMTIRIWIDQGAQETRCNTPALK